MANISLFVGALLVLLGGYFYAVGHHWTAFIPTVLGIGILVCGMIARDPAKRKHASHAGLGLGVLGLLGSLMTLRLWPKIFTHQLVPANRPLAVKEQFAMFVVCLVYLLVGGQSFMAARKARLKETPVG